MKNYRVKQITNVNLFLPRKVICNRALANSVNDPTLLWINSGLRHQKNIDGTETPEVPRITNAQKSIRTNDIENVGHTSSSPDTLF